MGVGRIKRSGFFVKKIQEPAESNEKEKCATDGGQTDNCSCDNRSAGSDHKSDQEQAGRKQKADYDGTSHCKNNGYYAKYIKCVAEKTDYIFYEIKKKDGEPRGVCRKRCPSKVTKQQHLEDDGMKNIQEISTYTGR